MFFQEVTPDTSGYMIAGYVISFVVMGLYVVSLYLRRRNLQQDMSILEEMDKSTPAPAEKKDIRKSTTSTKAKAVTKKVRN